MKYLVFYITDADKAEISAEELHRTVIKDTLAKFPAEFDQGILKEAKRKEDLKVVSLETEIRLAGRNTWQFDNGKVVKHFVAFDTETAPPTLIFKALDLQQLRWLEAPLPMSWLNEHGSIVSSDGKVVVRGESEPPDYNDLYGTNKINAVGTTGSTGIPVVVWPNQVSGGGALYPTTGSSAPAWIQGVSGNYAQVPYGYGSTAASATPIKNTGFMSRLFGP